MSESIVGEQSWEHMTEAERAEAVRLGHATLKQMMQGLLDGPDGLRQACRDFLSHTGASFDDIPIATSSQPRRSRTEEPQANSSPRKEARKESAPRLTKQRFGLPEGFTPRMQRYGRSILLEENIYRLPDGKEFIPCHPTGTLGRLRHLYALVTEEQHRNCERGSVYIRTDGRIFDYSVDHLGSGREMFDMGYTMHDLVRTGRYATGRSLPPERQVVVKQKRAAQAS